ncbi:protein of unknown function [Algoriphagus locisalis]|uniref:DUF4221 domain-containing protein n=1 Tax=Algoriphagus locisalis TaxID=305507 RepID=A0A1I7AN48_9BACT|nr:DUF4221 family protein [Algoriphagus locisalis]SFT76378.1 protein of unknown function [Algoriphagus locisalis]
MKRLLIFSFLTISFFSCGEKGISKKSESDNILENLTYSVDTVVVDPGDELINLAMGLYFFDVSNDSKRLYQLTPNDQSVAVIDLDRLELIKKIKFEKEGPNGIGSFPADIKVLPGENFMFSTFQSAGVFDSQTSKIDDITLKAEQYPELGIEESQDMNFQINISENGDYLYSLPGGIMESNRDLVVIDKSNNTGKKFDIPALDNTGKFSIMFFKDGMAEISMEDYFMDEYQGDLYLSSSVTSDLYRYNFQQDSLQLFSFPITVSPKEKTELPKREVSSKKEQQEESQKVRSQISFKHLMWDESRKPFFRIASITLPSETPGSPAKISVFLYAFDTNMKLVGETLIDDLKSIPESAFFKDGKLYSYVNVEDELGFAVFTFDF